MYGIVVCFCIVIGCTRSYTEYMWFCYYQPSDWHQTFSPKRRVVCVEWVVYLNQQINLVGSNAMYNVHWKKMAGNAIKEM